MLQINFVFFIQNELKEIYSKGVVCVNSYSCHYRVMGEFLESYWMRIISESRAPPNVRFHRSKPHQDSAVQSVLNLERIFYERPSFRRSVFSYFN